MEKRIFGNTGLDVSRLTFGCGAVGGLMTKGDAADQDRAVAWARDNSINFFDTAASYGNGASETNLGRALNGNTDGIVVSTKVGLNNDDLTDIAGAVARSLDASLTRLKLNHVDILQLHNTLGRPDFRGTLNIDQVLDDVIPALEKLKDAGKTRFLGFTAKGEADDVLRDLRDARLEDVGDNPHLELHVHARPVVDHECTEPTLDVGLLRLAAVEEGDGFAGGLDLTVDGAEARLELAHLLPERAVVGHGELERVDGNSHIGGYRDRLREEEKRRQNVHVRDVVAKQVSVRR